jgi:magnesium chelatase family protein
VRAATACAIRNAGLEFPVDRITVNLAPAEVRKVGKAFDLPMALGILAATGVVKLALAEDAIALGELSLDGRIQPVRGVLPVVLHCRRRAVRRLLVPAGNAEEAAVVRRVTVIPLGTLHVPARLRVAWGVRLHGWREASVRVQAVPAVPGPH